MKRNPFDMSAVEICELVATSMPDLTPYELLLASEDGSFPFHDYVEADGTRRWYRSTVCMWLVNVTEALGGEVRAEAPFWIEDLLRMEDEGDR